MKRSCKSLKENEQVVFLIHSNIYGKKIYEEGNVIYVTDTHVCVCWLDGYKSRSNDIPFSDMVAVYNPEGEYMTFDYIKGPSDLLEP